MSVFSTIKGWFRKHTTTIALAVALGNTLFSNWEALRHVNEVERERRVAGAMHNHDKSLNASVASIERVTSLIKQADVHEEAGQDAEVAGRTAVAVYHLEAALRLLQSAEAMLQKVALERLPAEWQLIEREVRDDPELSQALKRASVGAVAEYETLISERQKLEKNLRNRESTVISRLTVIKNR